jgi:hypothetical protein
MSRLLAARLFLAAVTTLALIFAALNPAPVRPLPPTPEETRALFDELVKDEPGARQRAREDWAHHPWSQQDAFGAIELERVGAVAKERSRSAQDLFLVIDEGLRQRWPGPDGRLLPATVVPLKPRPMD